MTRYQKLKARAEALGIKTVNDRNMRPMGYWILDKDGNSLFEGDSFCGTLDELEGAIDSYETHGAT